MKHTEVPHQLDTLRHDNVLSIGDKAVYAAIRRYMNKDTRQCFPSYPRLCEMLKISDNKLTASIKRLCEAGVLEKVSSSGKKSVYHFPYTDFDKQFEMFTDDFLELDLPLNVKEYYMDLQKYLYKKETGQGVLTFSNRQISTLLNLSQQSVKKYNTILIDKGYLTESMTEATDEYGLPVIQKKFDLEGLKQAALWVKQVTEAVQRHDDEIKELQEKAEKVPELERRIASLERALALQNNKPAPQYEYFLDGNKCVEVDPLAFAL